MKLRALRKFPLACCRCQLLQTNELFLFVDGSNLRSKQRTEHPTADTSSSVSRAAAAATVPVAHSQSMLPKTGNANAALAEGEKRSKHDRSIIICVDRFATHHPPPPLPFFRVFFVSFHFLSGHFFCRCTKNGGCLLKCTPTYGPFS